MFGCKKKKNEVCTHPLVTATVVGFAVIGMWGVGCAMRKKASSLTSAAKRLGGECVDSVSEKVESVLEEGIRSAEKMMGKGASAQ